MAIFVDNHTKLLLHGDKFEDESYYKNSITSEGATVNTSQGKFGNSSFYFNGSSRIKIPVSAHSFLANDFTVDWWEYSTSTSNGSRFCNCYNSESGSAGGMLFGYQGKSMYVSSLLGTSWNLVSNVTMFNVTQNQWVHWAVVRSGTSLKTYRNGTLFATTSINGSIYENASYPMVIGDYRVGDHNYWTGYIDEFRISDRAEWLSDFVPYTEPYTAFTSRVKINDSIKNISKGYAKINGVWKPISKSLNKRNSEWSI